MSDLNANQPPPTPTAPPPTPDPLAQLNTWAQAIGAKEKSEGRESAIKLVTDKLGMTVEEAEAFIRSAKDKERETMTEAERKLSEAKEIETRANQALTSASQAARSAVKRAALVTAGVTKEQAKVLEDLVKLPDDWDPSDDAKADEAVAELKKIMPQLFQSTDAEDDDDDQPAPTSQATTGPIDSTPRGKKPNGKPPASLRDKAAARLAERHPELAKKE